MHPNPRRILPIVILLLALAASAYWYFFLRPAQTASSAALSASGTIEAAQVQISPELNGKILEVGVAEGDRVLAGQELVRMDGALLTAQLEQARAARAQAQANYDLVAAGTPAEQRQAAITAADLELESARQALLTLNDTAALSAARLIQQVAANDKALDQARQRLDAVTGSSEQSDIDAARAAVTMAKDRLEKAREDYQRWEKKPEDNVTRAYFLSKMAAAETQYDAMVTRLNNLQGKANQYELALAEANVKLAEAALNDAKNEFEKVKDGPDPADVALVQARIAAAEARLAAAKAGPSAEQLAASQAAVESAQCAVETLELQISKLVLIAPSSGVVLSLSAEPGEFVLPGSALLTLARLDELTITIYIPEDRYGEISLGQEAQVQVDSFPGEIFTAAVSNIAGQAEFTPRNVQTVEGRKNTVFAIKLKLADPQGKLKPGMPADVVFQ